MMPDDPARRKKLLSSRLLFRFMVAILAAGICGLGWILCARAIPNLLRYHQSRRWTPQTCEILRSTYYRAVGSRSTGFKTDVSFRFSVEGKSFVSSTPDIWDRSFNTEEAVAEWLAPFQEGTSVPCLVNFAHPPQAILVRAWSWSGFAQLPVTSVFLIALLFLLNTSLRMLRELNLALAESDSYLPG